MTDQKKMTKWNREWKQIYTEFIQEYYTDKPCYICNEVGKIHYHHIDQETKEHEIIHMWSFKAEKIKLEVGKCVTLCEKCHRLTHKLKKEITKLSQ